jgi:hypothetical protein
MGSERLLIARSSGLRALSFAAAGAHGFWERLEFLRQSPLPDWCLFNLVSPASGDAKSDGD